MTADVPVSERVLSSRYRIGPLLGRGGMAEVYEGYDQRLQRPVAVKLLRPELSAEPEVRGRFEVEARAAAGLSHPNVVAVFDTGEDGGTPFIVMERLPGDTLADRMAAGPVDQAWLRRVACDVLGALGAAHAAGVVHRDVKPGNILIGADGCAKVADFGIAKSAEVAGQVTANGQLLGTPAYLAPERLDGLPATPRSDLYSLGVVLYEALTGVKPFEGPSPVDTANAVLHDRPRPLAELRPDADPDFVAAVAHAMSKDPAGRPASAGQMAREVSGPRPRRAAAAPTVTFEAPDGGADPTLLGAPLVSVPGTGPPPARTAGRRRRAPVVALVAGGLVILLVVVALAAGGGGAGGSDGVRLAPAIRDLAARVRQGDGPRGPEAAQRLETVADQVEAGGGSDDATSLLSDAGRWNDAGDLSDAATAEMTGLLGRIDGVDASVVTTTTTVPLTVPPPPVEGDDDDGGGGEKKKGKGRD